MNNISLHFDLLIAYFEVLINQTWVLSTLVCNRNHCFCLGPIPRQKPKLANTFSQYCNQYLNHISKGEFDVIFYKFLDYFWRSGFIFKLIKTWIPQKVGNKWEKKISFGKKIGYNTDTDISVPNIKTWFRSYTT